MANPLVATACDPPSKLSLDCCLRFRHDGDNITTVVICGDQTRDYQMAKSERLTVTLGPDQRRRLTRIAQRQRTSTATIIRWAVDDYIKRASRRTAKLNSRRLANNP